MRKSLLALAAALLSSSAFAGGALEQARSAHRALENGANTQQALGTAYDGQDPAKQGDPVAGIANGDGTAPRSNLAAEIKTPDGQAVNESGIPDPGPVDADPPAKEKKGYDWGAGIKNGFTGVGIMFGLLGMVLGACFGGPAGILAGAGIGLVAGAAFGTLLGMGLALLG